MIIPIDCPFCYHIMVVGPENNYCNNEFCNKLNIKKDSYWNVFVKIDGEKYHIDSDFKIKSTLLVKYTGNSTIVYLHLNDCYIDIPDSIESLNKIARYLYKISLY